MGQRASIVTINAKGAVLITTLQWSMHLDKTIANLAESSPETAGEQIPAILRRIAETWEHASCVQQPGIPVDLSKNPSVDEAASLLVGSPGCEREGRGWSSVERVPDGIYEYHLDYASIGAVCDERTPGSLEFFWRVDNRPIVTQSLTWEELSAGKTAHRFDAMR